MGEQDEMQSTELMPEHRPSSQIKDIDNLSGLEFEALVIRLLEQMGLQVKETKKSGDGGVDIVVNSTEPITGGLYMVQCKRHSSSIGEPIIRDLYGVVNHLNASKGILITNSVFTRQAKEFANGKPLELIDGNRLKELLAKFGSHETIPDGKKTARIALSHRRFFERLSRVAERISETFEVDLVMRSSVKDYPLTTFSQSSGRWLEATRRFGNVIPLLQNTFEKDFHNLTDEDIDNRVKAIDGAVRELLKAIKEISEARIEDRATNFRQALLDLCSAPLMQFANFIRDANSKIESLEGALVDKDWRPTLTLVLDIEKESRRFSEETQKLEAQVFQGRQHRYVERAPALAWLWTLLFGPLYFAYKGVWGHATFSTLLAIFSGGASWLIYPFFTYGIMRRHYLKKGRVEVGEHAEYYVAKEHARPGTSLGASKLGYLPEDIRATEKSKRRRRILGYVVVLLALYVVWIISQASGSRNNSPTGTSPQSAITSSVIAASSTTSSNKPTESIRSFTISKGKVSVPGTAYLDGRDLEASPALTVMNINIWDGVPRRRVLCTLQHGTSVTLLDAEWYATEGRNYFQIKQASCLGWVSEPFISDRYHQPVGSRMD